jgi:nitrite reductase (NO-forming)
MARTMSERTGEGADGDFPVELRAQLEELDSRETRLEGRFARRDNATVFVYVLAAVALIASVIAVGFAMRAVDEKDRAGASAGAGAGSSAAPASISVELKDLALSPSEATVAEGGSIDVTNHGAIPHDLAIKGTSFKTAMLSGGEHATLQLDGLAAGTYTMFCDVPGHEAAGMKATLVVGGATAATSGAATSSSASEPAGAKIDATAMPAPEWKAFDPTLQPAQGGTVHDVAFAATESVVEVAPGVTQELWTFNGQAPGPVLRGHVGDVFNVTLTNNGKLGHSIDFHASKVSPSVEMRTLQPGESLVYQFKADYAGIWMYHCGTAPALHHIGNGMFGTVIIDPPGLAPVDHEYVMVQSELYLGAQGAPGDLTKMMEERKDAVVFNGYYNQYKFSPITVAAGDRVRVWVLDAGPSENSAFHIVGSIFDTVFKEGAYSLRPGAGQGGAQVLDLQPAQGGFVEFTLDRDGSYPMVTHKFANVGKGALGLFQVGTPAGTMSH